MTSEQEFLSVVIRSAIKGEKITTQPQIDIIKFFKLANKHSLQVLTYFTLLNNGLFLDSLADLKKVVYKLILRANNLDNDIQIALNALKENDIKVITIKGYNIRKLYPNPDMRYLLDFDCLIEEKDKSKVKKLLKQAGFRYIKSTAKHLEFNSQTGRLLEFHTKLFERFLKDDYLQEVLSSPSATLNAEQEYIIALAHLASHFVSGGVGVRNIIDLYLLDKQIIDRQSLNAKLERVGLAEFDKNFQILAKDLFDNQTPTKQSLELMEYIYESEYLGGQDQKELFAMAMAYDGDIKKAKQSSVWQKIFPPYRHMVGIYPSLKKCPILLPIYHIRRYFAVIFKRRKNLSKLKKFNAYTEQEVIKISNILTDLGLKNK